MSDDSPKSVFDKTTVSMLMGMALSPEQQGIPIAFCLTAPGDDYLAVVAARGEKGRMLAAWVDKCYNDVGDDGTPTLLDNDPITSGGLADFADEFAKRRAQDSVDGES